MQKIQLGIIGYGGMGKMYDRLVPKSSVDIVAAADILPERVKEAADAGLRAYSSAEKLLNDSGVDTVILSVPNYLHKEMCLKAAKAGKHVISEKPAAMNTAELDEMAAACKNAGVVFTSHHNRRWDKDMLTVKTVIESGELGNVFTIESKLHSANGYMHEWHLYKKYGGGMMYDWSVHLIDQILFIFPNAKVKRVYADIKNVLHEEVDDYFKILLTLDNGVTAHIELSTYIMDIWSRWMAAGDKGTVLVKNFECDGNVFKTGKMLEKLPAVMAEHAAGPTRQFAPVPAGGIVEYALPKFEVNKFEFFENLRDVIYNGAEQLVKISEVRRVLSLMEAARRSSDTGTAIEFE